MKNIAIIDDHPIYARGLQLICKSIPEVNVTGVHYSIQSFVNDSAVEKINLIILDMQLQADDRSHCDVIKELKKHHPFSNILSVSDGRYVRDKIKALRAGAQGFINKSATIELLTLTIINTININQCKHSGIDPDDNLSLEKIMDDDRQYAPLLTSAEKRVLIGILNGKSITSIASKHGLSVKTISSQKRAMMKRCGIKNNIELFNKFKTSIMK